MSRLPSFYGAASTRRIIARGLFKIYVCGHFLVGGETGQKIMKIETYANIVDGSTDYRYPQSRFSGQTGGIWVREPTQYGPNQTAIRNHHETLNPRCPNLGQDRSRAKSHGSAQGSRGEGRGAYLGHPPAPIKAVVAGNWHIRRKNNVFSGLQNQQGIVRETQLKKDHSLNFGWSRPRVACTHIDVHRREREKSAHVAKVVECSCLGWNPIEHFVCLNEQNHKRE